MDKPILDPLLEAEKTKYHRRADISLTNRGDAAAATWTFREVAATGRGRDVDIPWRRIAATPRLRRGDSAESRRRAAAATWIFRGDASRRRRGCDVDIHGHAAGTSSAGTGRRRRRCFCARPGGEPTPGERRQNVDETVRTTHAPQKEQMHPEEAEPAGATARGSSWRSSARTTTT